MQGEPNKNQPSETGIPQPTTTHADKILSYLDKLGYDPYTAIGLLHTCITTLTDDILESQEIDTTDLETEGEPQNEPTTTQPQPTEK